MICLDNFEEFRMFDWIVQDKQGKKLIHKSTCVGCAYKQSFFVDWNKGFEKFMGFEITIEDLRCPCCNLKAFNKYRWSYRVFDLYLGDYRF